MTLLRVIPAALFATQASAHTAPLDHVHTGQTTVYPMLLGLALIVGAAVLAYRQSSKP